MTTFLVDILPLLCIGMAAVVSKPAVHARHGEIPGPKIEESCSATS
jgi:hypothetical protein